MNDTHVFPYDPDLPPGSWCWIDTAKTRRKWRCPLCKNVSAFHPDKIFGEFGNISPSVQCPHIVDAGGKCRFHVQGILTPEPARASSGTRQDNRPFDQVMRDIANRKKR